MNSHFSDDAVKTVIVLGSKPGALMPAVAADVVIGANSAIELAVQYREKYNSRIVAMTPCNHFGDKEYIQNSVRASAPDEVVILGACIVEPEAFVKNTLGLSDAQVIVLPSNLVNWSFLSKVGSSRYLIFLSRLLSRGVSHFFKTFLPDLLTKRDFDFLARSTCLNSIFYSLDRFKNIETIIIVGMGLQEGGHFNNLGNFTDKTAQSDRLVFKHWPSTKKAKLQTTDDKMAEIGLVKKWKGESL